jgi:Mg2+-importing ATPase
VLVIFVIRTQGSPFRSQPSRWLVPTSLAVVAIAVLLPFSPVRSTLGFVSPPLRFFPVLAALVGAYLVAVEAVKRWFYRRVAAPSASGPVARSSHRKA